MMSKIIRHSHGIKNLRDDRELNRMAFEDARRKKEIEAVTESNIRIAAIDARDRDNVFMRNSLDRAVMERTALHSVSSVLEQGKLQLFKEILLEMYTGSLLIDDYVVTENADRFAHLVSQYVDTNGGYAMLETAVKQFKLPILKAIKEACDSTALEASRRIGREARQNKELGVEPIFELNDEERESFDLKRSELNTDRLSELVKDKVLTVVKDERDRQSKEKELLEDLKAKSLEAGEEVEKKPIIGTSTLKESTLFNSIMHNTFTENLKAVSETYINFEDDDDDSEDLEGHRSDDPVSNSSVDLDTIMCESIIYYTLMELSNTICLETFNRNDIMNLSHKLLNQR